jgi:streptogramin lyase
MKKIIFIFLLLQYITSAQFTFYTPDNSDLKNKVTEELVVDYENRLWFVSSSSIYRIDGEDWVEFNSDNSSFPDETINKLYLNFDGKIWVLFEGAIGYFENDEIVIFDDTIGGQSFLIDHDSNIWIAKEKEIYTNKSGKWEKGFKNQFTSGSDIHRMIVDKNNGIWFDRSEPGIWKIVNDSAVNFTHPDIPLDSQYYYDIKLDSNDNIWIATTRNILTYNYKNDAWVSYKSKIPVQFFYTYDFVRLAFDTNNQPFMSIFSELLNKNELSYIVDEEFKFYEVSYKDPITDKTVDPGRIYSLAVDLDNNLWFNASGFGLGKLDTRISNITPLKDEEYNIFPIPTNLNLTIEVKNNESILNYEVYNTKGDLITNEVGSRERIQTINVSDLESGIYFIKVQLTNKKIIYNRFIKL